MICYNCSYLPNRKGLKNTTFRTSFVRCGCLKDVFYTCLINYLCLLRMFSRVLVSFITVSPLNRTTIRRSSSHIERFGFLEINLWQPSSVQ